MENNNKSKIKNWGYVFIAYFIYALIYPFILGMTIKGTGISDDVGPADSMILWKMSGVSPLIITLLILGGLAIIFIIPLASLAGGILMLKVKNLGRKIIVTIFGLDFIFRLGILLTAFSNELIKKMLIGDRITEIYYYIFIIIDVFIVCYFSTKKIKNYFNR